MLGLRHQVPHILLLKFTPAVAQHLQGRRVGIDHLVVLIQQQHAVRHVIEQVAPLGMGAAQLLMQVLTAQPMLHRAGEVAQNVALGVGELPWLVIECAQRSHGMTIHHQGHPCVEPHMRLTCHEWVVGKASIQPCIGHLKQIGLQDGVGTERQFAWRLLRIHPMARLEPLALGYGYGDHRDRATGQCRSGPNNAV